MPGLALFDLDNTLFDRDGAFRRWCEAFIDEQHLDRSAHAALVGADRDGNATRAEFFTAVKELFGIPDSLEELIEGYRTSYPQHYRSDPATIASLTRLRDAGWTLAVVTNGPPTQEEKIRRAGLADVLDTWCISEVVGLAKPDAEIFEHTARQCGLPLRGWMTGDSADADIVGGSGAGLQTIWLSRARVWQHAACHPDAIANGVSEAVDIILASET